MWQCFIKNNLYNIVQKNHIFLQDLNRLAILTDCNLVFFLKTETGLYLHFRDFRQDLLLPKCRYFVIENGTLSESQTSLDCLVNVDDYPFAKKDSLIQTQNILEGLAYSCQLQLSNTIKDLSVPSLDYLEGATDALFSSWKINILVVGFKGLRGKFPTKKINANYLRNCFKANKCIFEVRCIIASKEQKHSMKDLSLENFEKVICVFGNSNIWCQLQDAYQKSVLKKFLLKDHHDVLRDSVETVELGKGGPNLFAQTKEQELNSKKAKIATRKYKSACDKIKRYCQCHTCNKDVSYADNMNVSGPEKLLTHNLSMGEMLKALGLDCEPYLGIVEELSRLSVAAFDIESMTVALDHQRPGENLPQADIDFYQNSQHNLAVQKPIMLAHRDGLLKDTEQCKVFTLMNNNESDIYHLMRNYWKYLQERQKLCSKAKTSLALPLLQLLGEYHLTYLQYAKEWRDPNSGKMLKATEVGSGWKFSLPGRLQTRLKQLIERYEIFSFYGSGYDQVLLSNYLLPYLFEKKLRPKIEKNGNKVNVIKVTKCNITFRDVVRLLAPGTSLKQFGELFKLQQAKAHFPFGILTGVEALQLPKLPDDPELWRSELSTSKESITIEDIQEAQKLFEQSKCQNVGDYLKTYLQLDVDILYQATQGWRSTIAAEIGVDFVQDAKFTISSISNFAGDINAASNLYVGQFFPNSSVIYRLLRKGMRGYIKYIFLFKFT